MRRRRSMLKGVVAGLVGGFVGTVAMTVFQKGWTAAANKLNGDQEQAPEHKRKTDQSQDKNEDSTVKVAGKIADQAGIQLTTQEKKQAGSIVHYGFGTAMGLLFGCLREVAPRKVLRYPALTGMGFGSLVFLGADETAVPALKLSAQPSEKPASEHAYELAGHVIYGLTTGYVTKAVRSAL